MSNFNSLASFYDVLASFVFIGNINKANRKAAQYVTSDSKVLIIGGGTGRILDFFEADNLEIDYVELSTKMIEKAQKREVKSKVNFFQEDYLTFETKMEYDYIITPFFLDMFLEKSFRDVLTNITKHLKTGGVLLIADFTPVETNVFNRVLHRIMCVCFHYVSGIEITRYNHLFERVIGLKKFQLKESTSLFRNFIQVKKFVLRA